jgi:hypothetical protein
VPKSLRIRDECERCDVIHGIHNQIWACGACNSAKGVRGLYEFYRERVARKDAKDHGLEARATKYDPAHGWRG